MTDKFKALYIAVNEMMAPLGAKGEIGARSPEVTEVMDKLFDIDEGVYDADKVFGDTIKADAIEEMLGSVRKQHFFGHEVINTYRIEFYIKELRDK